LILASAPRVAPGGDGLNNPHDAVCRILMLVKALSSVLGGTVPTPIPLSFGSGRARRSKGKRSGLITGMILPSRGIQLITGFGLAHDTTPELGGPRCAILTICSDLRQTALGLGRLIISGRCLNRRAAPRLGFSP
jgi:hypothetical protein